MAIKTAEKGGAVHVVVALICRDSQVLLALRPDHAHQGGLWEFPGGKVGAGEQSGAALIREVQEELAIRVTASRPLFKLSHDYPDKSVLLEVWEVTGFSGEPVGNEGQQIVWAEREALAAYNFPAANREILDYLAKGHA